MKSRPCVACLFASCLLMCALGCDGDVELEVTPGELDFGSPKGDAHMHVTVKNTGSSGILWNEMDLTYEVTATEDWLGPCTGGTITAGDEESCEIWVYRDRLDPGNNSGWVEFTSDGGDASVKVLVTRSTDPGSE